MIYICIPAHDEERTIGVLLWKIRQVLADFPRDFQLLVANDGSADGTAEVLAPYQRVLPLTVLHTDRQRGYATALELLLREAVRRAEYPKRDVIVTLQADFTDDPDQVALLLKRIEAGADIVCANQSLPENEVSRGERWARRFGKFLVRGKGWPEGLTDPLSGLRAYRVMVVKRAIEQAGENRLLTWDGWAANAELMQRVAPYSRRTDCIETEVRAERRQRESRTKFWPVIRSLVGFAGRRAGPLAAEPLATATTVAAPRGPRAIPAQERRPDREGQGAREGRGREQRPGREGRPARESRPRDAQASREGGDRKARDGGKGPGGKSNRAGTPSLEADRKGVGTPSVEAGRKSAEGPRPRGGRSAERPAGGSEANRRDRRERRDGRDTLAPTPENGAVAPIDPSSTDAAAGASKKKRRRRRRRGGAANAAAAPRVEGESETMSDGPEAAPEDTGSEDTGPEDTQVDVEAASASPEGGVAPEGGPAKKRRRSRRGRGRRGRRHGAPAASEQDEATPPGALGQSLDESPGESSMESPVIDRAPVQLALPIEATKPQTINDLGNDFGNDTGTDKGID